jgi:hypothetical protein
MPMYGNLNGLVLAAVKPSIPGIFVSIKIISGSNSKIESTASFPLESFPITFISLILL